MVSFVKSLMCIVYKASFAPIHVGLWTLVEWNLQSKTLTQDPFCAVCIPGGDLWRDFHNIGVNFISWKQETSKLEVI